MAVSDGAQEGVFLPVAAAHPHQAPVLRGEELQVLEEAEVGVVARAVAVDVASVRRGRRGPGAAVQGQLPGQRPHGVGQR